MWCKPGPGISEPSESEALWSNHQLVKGDTPQVVVKVSELFLDHLAAVLQKPQGETGLLLSLRVCVKQIPKEA